MSKRYFKDRVVSGTSTFVAAIAASALCWALTGIDSWDNWTGFGAALVAMASLRHMINGNALMRIRTWMVPSTFILLCGTLWMLHPFNPIMMGTACYALSQYHLFKAYQNYHAERPVVISFILLGTASLFFPPLLYLSVSYYAALLIQLRAFTLRTLLAGLFGLLVPLELYAGCTLLSDHRELLEHYVTALTDFDALSLPQWSLQQFVNGGLIALLFIIGCLHYLYTSFNDKIHTRMCFYVIIVQCLILYAALALQPRLFNCLLPFIVLESSPVIGHYLTFSKGRTASVCFMLAVFFVLAVIVFNILWNTSLHFF